MIPYYWYLYHFILSRTESIDILTFSLFQLRLYPNSVYHGRDIIFKRIYNFYILHKVFKFIVKFIRDLFEHIKQLLWLIHNFTVILTVPISFFNLCQLPFVHVFARTSFYVKPFKPIRATLKVVFVSIRSM